MTEAALPVPIEGEPAAAPPPPRAYELPTARGVVTYGLQLAYRSSAELRRASLYIGVLTLALLGPPLVFAVELVARYQFADIEAFIAHLRDPSTAARFLLLIVAAYPAIFGWLAVAIDGQLIAVTLLAARAADRPMSLREATTRARQVFWRMIRGSFLAGLASALVQFIVSAVLVALLGRTDAGGVVVTVAAAIFLAPLGYLATGIVIGDVGAIEALKRSIRLARARPRIALVVALFTLVTAAVQTFALSAGLDLFITLGAFLHVGINAGVGPFVVALLGLLAFIMAFGSLNFTIAAIVAAPQVAAFLGLTYYAGGLDRVHDLPADAPRFRWVTRPMVVLIVVVAVLSAIGLTGLPAAAVVPR